MLAVSDFATRRHPCMLAGLGCSFFHPIHIIDVFIHLPGCKGRWTLYLPQVTREVYFDTEL